MASKELIRGMQGSYKQEARKQDMEQEGRHAVTRIRTEVAAATTQSTNHYTITASHAPGDVRYASAGCRRCWPSLGQSSSAGSRAALGVRSPLGVDARTELPAPAERRPAPGADRGAVSARLRGFSPACRPADVTGARRVGSPAERTRLGVSWSTHGEVEVRAWVVAILAGAGGAP